MKLRSAIAVFGLFIASSVVNAQSITPGVYQTPDGSSVSVKFDESGNMVFKDYRSTTVYVKQADGKFVHPKYPELYVSANGAGGIVNAETNSKFRKEFKLYAPANATPAKGVIAFTVSGDTYYAKKETGAQFCGLYKYTGKEPRFFEYAEGEPIVLLKAEEEGSRFQAHGVPSIPMKWWLESDYKGNLQVVKGELVDRYCLVVQYGPGSTNYPEGTYDRMNLDVYKDGSKVVILGERIKQLN